MHIALHLNVQVKDGALVLTTPTGNTVSFSNDQTVQQKVSRIVLGELCNLPKHQLATGFGFKSRTSYDDIRNTVLQGPPADLLPKRTGPHTPSKRTKELEARIIRTRFETDGNRYAIADAFTPLGFTVSPRLVGHVLADDGLAKKTGCHPRRCPPDSSPKRRLTSSTGPASHAHTSSPGMTSRLT
jgi:hypothetical protein